MTAELVQIFDASVSAEFLRDAVVTIQRGWQDSYEDSRDRYPWQIAHDRRPHERRAMIDQRLYHLAGRHPGIHASIVPNRIQNSYHTQLRSGQVVLTQACVLSPDSLPRHAEYRETLARHPQRALPSFSFVEEAPPAAGTPLYALLVHGADELDPTRPGFVQVIIPNRRCTVVLAKIDLIRRFPDLAATLPGTGPEVIEDRLEIAVRPRQATRAEGSD